MENNEAEKTLVKLVNPEFDFEFMGQVYRIRKATLDKMIQYQSRVGELAGDVAAGPKMISYGIYLLLKDKIPDLTEQTVLENIPGNIEFFEIMESLGFFTPRKTAEMKQIQETLKESPGETSSL